MSTNFNRILWSSMAIRMRAQFISDPANISILHRYSHYRDTELKDVKHRQEMAILQKFAQEKAEEEAEVKMIEEREAHINEQANLQAAKDAAAQDLARFSSGGTENDKWTQIPELIDI